MKYKMHCILTSLRIAGSSLLVGYKMPVDDTSTYYESHCRLLVVTADGNFHWILADSAFTYPVLTDSLVIFGSDNLSLCKVRYDGSNLTRLYPGVPWVDRSLSPRGDKILLASSVGTGYLNEFYLLDPHRTSLVKLAPQQGSYGWSRISTDLDEIVLRETGALRASSPTAPASNRSG